ncbi:hypothetical protein RFW18_02015 [Metabacillus idriensis]|uniref:hypothetical protein n=1 Tax=Metabacillus idriensis TaxID=324768 RepID=UPI002813F7CC|nr:hypothetical protein [Metabacillus idriensis]MDR0136506.1 hypothetical protein [Metabacillus idriensis]
MKKQEGPHSAERFIQLQQQILHYRSELSRMQKLVNDAENQVKKEIIRNQYLQEKLNEALHTHTEQYEKEVFQLEKKVLKLEVALEEEKRRTADIRKKMLMQEEQAKPAVIEPVFQVHSYFQASIFLPQSEDDNLSVFGDYIIKNTGNQPLQQPIICIQISPLQFGSLSGKIIMQRKMDDTKIYEDAPSNHWKHVHENWRERIRSENQYWLQPITETQINPNEDLIFSGFEISFPIPDKRPISVKGFVYAKELPKGVSSLNHLSIQ